MNKRFPYTTGILVVTMRTSSYVRDIPGAPEFEALTSSKDVMSTNYITRNNGSMAKVPTTQHVVHVQYTITEQAYHSEKQYLKKSCKKNEEEHVSPLSKRMRSSGSGCQRAACLLSAAFYF